MSKTITVLNKDTHTLCPASDKGFMASLREGSKIKYKGETLTVKGVNAGVMAWFQEKGRFHVDGAKKDNPVAIEIELLDEE